MKLAKTIIMSCEILLIVLLLLGILSKVTGYDDNQAKSINSEKQHIKLDDELAEKLLS